ncbi:hypothetical protein ACIPY3_14950 [Paenarthrobacter sp. NPDC089714]|uniref:hypothetical protein n=1 Tax=unclassified Paenarthrobacter TaxID=2634190 RepID=UPI0037F7DFD0
MAGFVIKYNRRTGDRIVKEFPGRLGHREALKLRLELERERESREWEIVSLNSDSLETVKKTHSRYFTGHLIGA